jgi:hypothetical protein
MARHGVLTPTGAVRAVWSLVMVLVMAVLVAGGGIAYTRHVQQQADRRWCDLLGTLDQPRVPPTTARGRAVQDQIHRLHGQLGCGRR